MRKHTKLPFGHTQITPTWHVLRLSRAAFFGKSRDEVFRKEREHWAATKAARKPAPAPGDNQAKSKPLTIAQNELEVAWRAAREFRAKHTDMAAHGFVVVNQAGKAAGWMNQLRAPGHWEPGCVAVDTRGSLWLAIGCNSFGRVREWRQIYDAFDHLPEGVRQVAREEQAAALSFTDNLGRALPC